jgi:hypothetical protein
MSVSQNFPTIRPTLNLNFARSKTLDPRITFTRSSTATYVGADGLIKTAGADEARFDYDPATGESLGLLIEESRSNVWLSSELPNNWAQVNTAVTNNYTTSPSGTQTAGKIVFSGTTSDWDIVYQGYYTGTYVWSAWLKTEDGSSKTVYVTWGSPDNAKRVALSINGTWRRYSALVTPSNENVHLGNHLDLTPAGWTSFAIHIWGVQVEVGSFPTSYIPTSGSTATRSADTAQITGTNFSSWYIENQGTFFAEFDGGYESTSGVNGYGRVIGFGFNHSPISSLPGYTNAYHSYDGVNVTNLTGAQEHFSNQGKFAVAWSDGTSSLVSYPASASGVFNPNSHGIIYLGSNGPMAYFLNGRINRIMYFNKRLTNAQLQELTK